MILRANSKGIIVLFMDLAELFFNQIDVNLYPALYTAIIRGYY